MVEVDGKIVILCGALADQTAGEQKNGGIFTRALLNALKGRQDLMELPLDLASWKSLLPERLLREHGIEVPTTRDALDPSDTQPNSPNRSGQNFTAPFQQEQQTAV
jgi:hypothetical protein